MVLVVATRKILSDRLTDVLSAAVYEAATCNERSEGCRPTKRNTGRAARRGKTREQKLSSSVSDQRYIVL